MLSERCVAVVAAKTEHAFELAGKWIQHTETEVKCAGYATYTQLV